jgi:hypothetical protein
MGPMREPDRWQERLVLQDVEDQIEETDPAFVVRFRLEAQRLGEPPGRARDWRGLLGPWARRSGPRPEGGEGSP